ncbi:TPA: hypothetical protein IUD88_001173 [Enterococcus faecalis]|nr:hypothetical protein [Enterococcus faecalis]HBI2046299.1 hypothetical protein [Enterococcus faecalis]
MSLYDEKSDKYIPLKSDKQLEIDESDREFDSENDYLQDFTPFTLEEPTYITNGPKDKYILDLSDGMRTKASSKAVRKIIYRFMRWCGYWIMKIQDFFAKLTQRQIDVEKRQVNVEEKFKQVIANATSDSEVINARDSETFGPFIVLDDRLEYIEKLLNAYVPKGNLITIKREVNALPQVVVQSYDYGLGILPLGMEPEGFFGGTVPEVVPSKLKSWQGGEVVVQIPKDFSDYMFSLRPKKSEYLFLKETQALLVTVSSGEPIDNEEDPTQGKIETEE